MTFELASGTTMSNASTASEYPFIESELHSRIESSFERHPFTKQLSNPQHLLANFLALSTAFPYLQAASQKDLIFAAIESNSELAEEVEITSVVGNFLSWDETGGHQSISKFGIEGLPLILNTTRNFHSHLLVKDLEKLIGKHVKPDYSPVTKKYLYELYGLLSSANHIERCATMVAFELHAEVLIEVLWTNLANYFGVDKDELLYFKIHVGDDDPAEQYHITMTEKMIDRIVPKSEMDLFYTYFEKSYALNFNWCKDIVESTHAQHSEGAN